MSAPDVAASFPQHVFRVHGVPLTLVNDRDPIFTSHFWGRLLELPCQPLVHLPSLDGWPDREAQFRSGALLSHVLRVPAYRLGQSLALSRVLLQQLKALVYNPDPVLRELRVPSQNVPASPIPPPPNPSRGFVRAVAPRGASHASTKARKAMELSAYRRRRPAPDLVPGQKVWLLRRHISTTRPSSKLNVSRLGPFAIIGPIGRSTYKVLLPPSMKVHPVFHVSLLEPHVANTFSGRVVAAPLPIRWTGSLNSRLSLSSTPSFGAASCSTSWIGSVTMRQSAPGKSLPI